MVIKRIAPMSLGKMLGVLYAVIGVLIGLVVALLGGIMGSMASAGTQEGPNPFAMVAGMGIAAIIIAPIMYGVMGFIGGIIMAALYNLFAGMVGGIEIETA